MKSTLFGWIQIMKIISFGVSSKICKIWAYFALTPPHQQQQQKKKRNDESDADSKNHCSRTLSLSLSGNLFHISQNQTI